MTGKSTTGKSDVYQLGMLIGNLEKVIYKLCKDDQDWHGLGEVQRTGTKSTMGKYDVCRQLLMSICNLKNFAVENICEDNQECFEFLDGEEGALEQNDK